MPADAKNLWEFGVTPNCFTRGLGELPLFYPKGRLFGGNPGSKYIENPFTFLEGGGVILRGGFLLHYMGVGCIFENY